MIIHNSTESYTRPVVNIGVRQQSVRSSIWDIPGGSVLWKAIGRLAGGVCAATIAIHLMLGAYSSHLSEKVTAFEGQRHQLMDRNITLRATRAGMLTKQAVEAAAGKALSLYSPGKGQRFVYNRNKGWFDSL
ncbi:hypothetical protein [Desulfopila aestuarii]|uniref:Uncharacterized protein n=1 Tax=Desulfopila aestuarii DSM 18488 TaxID=1121416 RepID=A0A1M7XZE8_9BACT|nr:hypothetical protein [Desulfopila aestuarii]SHO44443.1 hypothetical protein SAMN02745220_00748 [Desulfopila aestuarii DSM 18488]